MLFKLFAKSYLQNLVLLQTQSFLKCVGRHNSYQSIETQDPSPQEINSISRGSSLGQNIAPLKRHHFVIYFLFFFLSYELNFKYVWSSCRYFLFPILYRLFISTQQISRFKYLIETKKTILFSLHNKIPFSDFLMTFSVMRMVANGYIVMCLQAKEKRE